MTFASQSRALFMLYHGLPEQRTVAWICTEKEEKTWKMCTN